MFDEEKVKKDIKAMKERYTKALKEMDDILARQEEIAKKIYRAKKKKETDN